MRVTAKVDYAVRAAAELAGSEGRGPVKGERIAEAQGIPLKHSAVQVEADEGVGKYIAEATHELVELRAHLVREGHAASRLSQYRRRPA